MKKSGDGAVFFAVRQAPHKWGKLLPTKNTSSAERESRSAYAIASRVDVRLEMCYN